ncbi:unnamed protein product [Rhodiola kirilowii]
MVSTSKEGESEPRGGGRVRWEEQVDSITDNFQGKLMVSLEEEDWEKMAADCGRALVLKLANGMAFNLTGLSKVLCKIWNVEDKVKVCFKELANNMVLARFKFKSDLVRIKEGGPWHCMDTVVLMHEWCPELAPEEFVMNKLGVWAQLHNLPVGAVLNDREIGERLAVYIGRFIRVSQAETEETKGRYIRVRVELDIDKPVVEGFYLKRQSRNPLWISVIYERLPSRCAKCGRITHVSEDCDSLLEEDKSGERVKSGEQGGGSRSLMAGHDSNETDVAAGNRQSSGGQGNNTSKPAVVDHGDSQFAAKKDKKLQGAANTMTASESFPELEAERKHKDSNEKERSAKLQLDNDWQNLMEVEILEEPNKAELFRLQKSKDILESPRTGEEKVCMVQTEPGLKFLGTGSVERQARTVGPHTKSVLWRDGEWSSKGLVGMRRKAAEVDRRQVAAQRKEDDRHGRSKASRGKNQDSKFHPYRVSEVRRAGVAIPNQRKEVTKLSVFNGFVSAEVDEERPRRQP